MLKGQNFHPLDLAYLVIYRLDRTLIFHAGFTVETDVYMFFVYPDVEELFVQETVVKDIAITEQGSDSIFPSDAINSFDVTTAYSDNVGIADEECFLYICWYIGKSLLRDFRWNGIW